MRAGNEKLKLPRQQFRASVPLAPNRRLGRAGLGGRRPDVACRNSRRSRNEPAHLRAARGIDRAGHRRCSAFEDPLAALEWLAGNTPDLVITDFKMPNLDGAEFTRRFRELPGCADVPVVVITVYDERSFRLSALEAGATDFLHSPVDHSEFVTRARNLLKLRKQQLLLAEPRHIARARADPERAVARGGAARQPRAAGADHRYGAGHDQRRRRGRPLRLHQRLPRRGARHRVDRSRGQEHRGDLRQGARRAQPQARPPGLRDAARRCRASRRSSSTATAIGACCSPRSRRCATSPARSSTCVTTSLEITDRKRAERHLLHLAHHDPLTDLPNRMLLTQKLALELETRRGRRRLLRAAFPRSRSFQGHQRRPRPCDRRPAAHRARPGSCRRRSARPTSVARLGGDEFAIAADRHRRTGRRRRSGAPR